MNLDLCEGIKVDNQWCRAFLFNFKDKVCSSISLVANFHSCIHCTIIEKVHILTYVKFYKLEQEKRSLLCSVVSTA